MDLQPPNAKLLLDLMSASVMRAKVLGNNVANQNVPGYIRQDVLFESKLSRALARGKKTEDLRDLDPEIVEDHETPKRADGNNVVVEEELSLSKENRLLFELYGTILRGQSGLIRTAITGRR